ncbi:MAG TPA: ferric reductase-like transmembrane domain-containing protein [Candidatus Limnocylindrales bacterium]|nr:ferric reductase-like transmembrane domain-containing protein [Candidatus Limnocylindrales bacterium]
MTKASPRTDWLAFLFSVGVIGAAGVWIVQHGLFSPTLAQTDNWTWYVIRASGLMAYVLLTVTTLWGVALSSRLVKNWSPGPLSMVLHSTLSWLALSFAGLHAVLLMADRYLPYQFTEVLIPFTGPYRPLAVGLGTLSLWVILVVTLSFSFKKRLGHRAWKLIHLSSYLAFVLVTVHGLTAGTDASRLGVRLMLVASVSVVTLLLAMRVARRDTPKVAAA